MLNKPPIGSPCNNCGLCCKIQVCLNGAYVQGLVNSLGDTVPGPCPALVQHRDGTYHCGIVLNPERYLKHRPYPAAVLSRNFAHLIGAGNGCDELGYSEDEADALDAMIEATKNDPAWQKRTRIALKVIHGIET